MRWWLRLSAALLGLLVICFCIQFYANRWDHSALVISPATTRLIEPLDEMGYPDYVAALNVQLSKGVTADNNAMVPLMQALGPKEIPATYREDFFRRLGIAP
jgi:hypothetical protein